MDPTVTISVISILIVAAIARHVFDGKEDD